MVTKKQLWINLISFSILPVTVFSVTPYPAPFTQAITLLQNTTMWWIIKATILFFLLYFNRPFYDTKNRGNMRVVQFYLLWNVVSFIHGLFVAEIYWDWKGLINNTMALMLPLVAFTATNKMLVQSILSFYVRYTLPLTAVFVFIISTDAQGFYLVPVSFLMLFFPVLTNRWKMVVMAFTLFVLLVDLDARSNVIKFGVPFILIFVYYFKKYITPRLMEIVRVVLIVLPVILFALGVSGIFNVFRMNEYIGGKQEIVKMNNKGEVEEVNLKADTRTFLYVEVLYSAKKFDIWWFGRSPARGNLSEEFGKEDETGRGERLTNEVAILNVFTWTGIVGLVLYLLVFYRASFLAVNRSNNIFSKTLGLFVAFRWLYSWVEDVNDFSLNYYMLWIMIGLCFSRSFRHMTDKEVAAWVRGIFNFNRQKMTRGKPVEARTDGLPVELAERNS
ncbi:MAG TPA: hypothetical protein VK152_05390 [Paludibacter sp.]|nr:hypothetical protein [Paludibacter sp.]